MRRLASPPNHMVTLVIPIINILTESSEPSSSTVILIIHTSIIDIIGTIISTTMLTVRLLAMTAASEAGCRLKVSGV